MDLIILSQKCYCLFIKNNWQKHRKLLNILLRHWELKQGKKRKAEILKLWKILLCLLQKAASIAISAALTAVQAPDFLLHSRGVGVTTSIGLVGNMSSRLQSDGNSIFLRCGKSSYSLCFSSPSNTLVTNFLLTISGWYIESSFPEYMHWLMHITYVYLP